MVKELQVTLYDMFGFLLPGVIVLATGVVLFWAVYLPQPQVTLAAPDATGWVVLVVLAYFCGHMAQSFGNVLEKLYKPTEDMVLKGAGPYRLPDEVVQACAAKAKETLGLDASGLAPKWLYRLCDDAVQRSGKLGEREVYVYREGFYRGTAVAFLTLAFSLLVLLARLYFGEHEVLRGSAWEVQRGHLWFLALFAVAFSYLAFRRYRRFGMYRVTQAMLGFLTIKEDKKPDAAKKEA